MEFLKKSTTLSLMIVNVSGLTRWSLKTIFTCDKIDNKTFGKHAPVCNGINLALKPGVFIGMCPGLKCLA